MKKLSGYGQTPVFTSLIMLLEDMEISSSKLYKNSSVFNVDLEGEIVTITLPDTLLNKLKEM